ncbi:hypothetical protein OC846_002582 [Tilletia horrida]|uniref:Domain of unknown function at the cortex 1 domain-containing protein n=1 Tax=Tilletia horrida TaxID=155126 RepID=A0AAN6GU57_9BASI|nr:hypothetical protein OC845_006447 [Tilletia horrida]KAK0553337.1 hypothetical protein OC846_002582 [Tilletia horrida]KAK0567722.1 hypothetical protein OC861_002578 [Tilletia horrida]
MPRLEVKVGPDRFHMEPCRVNDSHRPHEIATEHFVGRVFVRILDAPGARQGEEGREYFRDRSRRFCIQIEGRFTKPWNGNEVLFGTDFDKLIDFPRAPFNAGMKVAQFIDPCTFYEEKPPSGRPYIMSPFCACMNTLAAWPAPDREHDAVVVLRDVTGSAEGDETPDHVSTPKRVSTPLPNILAENGKAVSSEPQSVVPPGVDAGPQVAAAEEDDIVPVESIPKGAKSQDEKSKKRKSWFGLGKKEDERKPKRYWRFVGFKNDVRVRAFLEAHHAQLENDATPSAPSKTAADPESKDVQVSTAAASNSSEVQHAPGKPTLSRLGTFSRKDMDALLREGRNESHPSPVLGPNSAGVQELSNEINALNLGASSSSSDDKHPGMPELERITTNVRTEMEQAAKKDGLQSKDFKLADKLHHHSERMSRGSSADGWVGKLDDKLGPWRFSDPGTDMLEDNAFIFTNQSLPVPRRRKYFSNLQHRLDFKYDPDVVYAANFFTPMCDLNTMDLNVGPVHMNIGRFFKDMPIRYTLRAADENITFATISFQLVD